MSVNKMLSLVACAVQCAPEGTDVKPLRDFLSKYKVSSKELDAMLERSCTDVGAIAAARGETVPAEKVGVPAKKKAAKKKAK